MSLTYIVIAEEAIDVTAMSSDRVHNICDCIKMPQSPGARAADHLYIYILLGSTPAPRGYVLALLRFLRLNDRTSWKCAHTHARHFAFQ